MTMNDPRIGELAEARRQLARFEQRWEDYTGNNPNKYRGDLNLWRGEVDRLERALKKDGVLPVTDEEKLEFELDRRFPGARSREVVEFDGKKYRRRFSPAEFSRTRKSVTRWHKWWEPVSDAC